jgi:hypothetical protein
MHVCSAEREFLQVQSIVGNSLLEGSESKKDQLNVLKVPRAGPRGRHATV